MSLTVSVIERAPGIFTLLPVGAIDSNTYTILEKELDSLLVRNAKVIVFDMEKVDYMSSAGVRIIFKAIKIMKENDGSVLVAHLQPQIKKVLEIIKASSNTGMFKSVEELDIYLDRIQKEEKGKR
jgi:anti-sigma B factor antagonist